ncbi:integrase, partial [Klebsiella pneumoniae]|nr:integrase [Klebsiella pneumoniae]
LTLVRAGGCRGARFDEIDGDIWTVPADRMKGRVGSVSDFRVPLSAPARLIVKEQALTGGAHLFSGTTGQPISDAAL